MDQINANYTMKEILEMFGERYIPNYDEKLASVGVFVDMSGKVIW